MKATAPGNFREKVRLFRRLIIIMVLLLFGGFGAILLGRMDDTVIGRGVVEGLREYEMKSAVQSRIVTLEKHNGDTVKKGELLLTLDDRELTEARLKLANQIRELEAEIETRNYALEITRRDPLPKEYRHTEIATVESREREIKSRHELEVFRKLREREAISEMELQKKELEYLKVQAELKKNEEDLRKLRDGLATQIIAHAENELELLRRRLAGRKSELQLLADREKEYRFIAPEDGTISYIPTKVGIYVAPGDTLAILAAAGPKKFTAYIDEKQIHKVREGQRARIASSQYNYFEYGYFHGKVYAIDELPVLRGNRNCYGVRILLEDGVKPLRLGSTGEAEIITGRDYIFKVLSGM